MERKRKLPARGSRAESASKKRAPSTSPDERRQTPTPAVAAPPPIVEESLPKSIAPGKPLPTLDHPQPENLPSKEFQTVSESGVLAESLNRSRQKWISEGIFEKYWTKPVKKKGAPEQPPNNPPKDSMTKLGTCTITVEPHIIEAVMYAIKEPNTRPTFTSAAQQTMYRPIIQYGPPNGMMPPPASPSTQKPYPLPKTAQPSPRTQQNCITNSVNPATVPNSPQATPSAQSNSVLSSLPNGQPAAHPNTPQQNPPHLNNAPPADVADKSKDPVIQMLAERASTDPDLKALMRIVANGQASAEELKKFQSHIDDLTRIQKARQAAIQNSQPTTQLPPPPPPGANTQINSGARPALSPAPSSSPSIRAAPTPPGPVSTSSQFQPQPQALRSKGPVPSSKPDISGVVFEFTGGSGDRFLFPKFSILDYRPQGEVIASFLIVRKGSASDSPSYDPTLDYYQPITIRLYAHQGRQLEALQKVVAPQDEVRRYMDDIMDNMTRAEYVLLAMRLPKDVEQPQPEKDDSTPKTDQVDNQVLWATTNPTPVAKVKPAKRLLTEEEKIPIFHRFSHADYLNVNDLCKDIREAYQYSLPSSRTLLKLISFNHDMSKLIRRDSPEEGLYYEPKSNTFHITSYPPQPFKYDMSKKLIIKNDPAEGISDMHYEPESDTFHTTSTPEESGIEYHSSDGLFRTHFQIPEEVSESLQYPKLLIPPEVQPYDQFITVNEKLTHDLSNRLNDYFSNSSNKTSAELAEDQVNSRIESMITLTRLSLELKAELDKLVMLIYYS
ncbi:hypothetical protein G7Y89_g6292 [Cudoniella acicularis]|uniref:SWR1-complex protein 3 domain-containing protein n=1 Tax=Cudoniella acicularis TaxID=354080 RepID=A0A8H4W306_9HELO|nr:hypothetical protein G7Y89_g6292 [Cudoniella acicularis]